MSYTLAALLPRGRRGLRVLDSPNVSQNYGSLVPDAARYTPPELARNGWDAIKRSNHWVVDSFDFGVLIYESFNGDYTGTEQAGQTKSVPPTMQTGYKRLVNANPKARISVGSFLEMGQRGGGFFDSPLIKLTDGIENLGVKSPEEREAFLEYVGFFPVQHACVLTCRATSMV